MSRSASTKPSTRSRSAWRVGGDRDLSGRVPMTSPRDHQSLSNLELLVLARLSCSKGASEDEVTSAIAEVAPSDGPLSAQEQAMRIVDALRQHGLAIAPKPPSPKPRRKARRRPTVE